MKILLVRPRPHADSVGLQSFMICEPLELEYASAVARREGHETVLADLILDPRPFERILRDESPDVVAFTAYITHVNVVKDLARRTKAWNPSVPTLVGGVHAEVVPTDLEDPALDFVLHARALEAWVRLLAELRIPLTETVVKRLRTEIPGVWDGPAKDYPRTPLLPDTLPHRELSARWRPRYDYIFHSRCALLKTSLGCAYGCDFCFCTEIARHRLVERNLDEVVEEIRSLPEENVFVCDDNFLFRPERVREFCDRLDAAGLRKRFLVFGRADFVVAHPDVLERFRASGLEAVFMGLESFRETDLTDMKKRVDVQTNVEAVRILSRLGIECHAGIIVGPDWETRDFDHLSDWLVRLGRPFVNIQPLTPMPGTPLFERGPREFAIQRQRHELWDMTHLVVAPTRMSRRRFQWNVMRTYYRSTTSLSNHLHILRRYGVRVWARTARGSLHLTLQYLRMLARGT